MKRPLKRSKKESYHPWLTKFWHTSIVKSTILWQDMSLKFWTSSSLRSQLRYQYVYLAYEIHFAKWKHNQNIESRWIKIGGRLHNQINNLWILVLSGRKELVLQKIARETLCSFRSTCKHILIKIMSNLSAYVCEII